MTARSEGYYPHHVKEDDERNTTPPIRHIQKMGGVGRGSFIATFSLPCYAFGSEAKQAADFFEDARLL